MTDKEKWAVIPKFRNQYSVSTFGRVKNNETGAILRGWLDKGYTRVNLCQQSFRAHRLVAEAFLPHDKLRTIINHKDFDRNNNHVSNLEWVTRAENNTHAHRAGRVPVMRGSKHWNAVLIEADVSVIKARHAGGESITTLSKEYSCNHGTIYFIVTGATWKHVQPAI